MSCSEIFALLSDGILSGAAITGAVVAVRGLNTWRSQLKGRSEYDLARRLLVTLFKYRDAVHSIRHPMMWANEMPSPPANEAANMSPEQIIFYGSSKAYESRADKAQKERAKLYADLLESEALWGTDLKNLFDKIYMLEHELITNIKHYLQLSNPDTNEGTKAAIQRIYDAERDIMYDDLSDEEDDYKRDFRVAVESIENYLKPKLIR